MASVDTGTIEGEIDRFRSLGIEELRREWRRLNHTEPPRISHDLLILGLGYRLQEITQGGLGKSTRRKLQTMAKALQTTGRVGLSLPKTPSSRLAVSSESEHDRRMIAIAFLFVCVLCDCFKSRWRPISRKSFGI
jgi:hypothetical protein